MTKAGIKIEDYREITPYWFKRLVKNWHQATMNGGFMDLSQSNIMLIVNNSSFSFKPFLINRMTLGYPRRGNIERRLNLKHKGIEIRTGNPECGAEPNKLYFVIIHGDIICEQ